MLVGVPRAPSFYYYYPLVKTFFEGLGCQTLLSPTTKVERRLKIYRSVPPMSPASRSSWPSPYLAAFENRGGLYLPAGFNQFRLFQLLLPQAYRLARHGRKRPGGPPSKFLTPKIDLAPNPGTG